jgi:hypothetical protein
MAAEEMDSLKKFKFSGRRKPCMLFLNAVKRKA